MPSLTVQRIQAMDDEDSKIALMFVGALAEFAKQKKLEEDLSEIFAEHYLRFRTAVEKRNGRTKVWNQTVFYGLRVYGRHGVCWALSYLWLTNHHAGSLKALETADESVLEELDWLLELQRNIGTSGVEDVLRQVRAFMSQKNLRVKDPYISPTGNPLWQRGTLDLPDGISVACTGDNIYSVLSLDGVKAGHSVTTLLYPGGVSTFFDPNLGRAIFSSSFDMKAFLRDWLPVEYSWAKSADVDRYYA